MKRGDDGVTLVELLICIVLMGVLASALTSSFFASTRSIDQSGHRLANTHDSQMAASLFSSDMQSANWIWTATAFYPFQTCGSVGDPLVTFAWPGSNALGNQETKVATYRVIDQDGEHQLVRQLCSGPVFDVPVTPKSTVVIAHNLNGPPPTVECFDSGNATLGSCDGPVVVAQLTAHAQANDADVTGFTYVLRATRRPTAPAPAPVTPPSTPAFVQAAADDARNGETTSAATFTSTAGNLIVAYVVWDNSGAVNVGDSSNTYTQASVRVPWTGGRSAQVFYARNVTGGSTTVTATFATALSRFGLLYVTEYSGIDKTNPFDATSIATGASAAMSSGTAATTNANDLLVGLGASDNVVTAPGAGYTSRLTDFGNIVEDRTVTATGGYTATATQNGNGWVMQIVAFRAAAAGGAPPP